MKKVISLTILLTLITVSLFAGFSIEANMSYMKPVAGWNLKTGSDNQAAGIYSPGFLYEVEPGYAFNDYVRLGISAGFGMNEIPVTKQNLSPYFVPVMINGTFSTPDIDRLSFYAKAGAGGYVRIDNTNKKIYLGPIASVTLGAEINIVKGLSIGLYSRLMAEMEVIGATTLQLDLVPFGITVRYEI